MAETISFNSDAILLLTAPLAVRGEVQEGIEPLSTEEYGFLARQLLDMKRKPSDLLNPENTELIHSCGELVDAERLKALLGRKAELSRARAAWRSLGIWCCTRADRDYPKILKAHLREDTPPAVWGCGNLKLLQSDAFSVLGTGSKNKHYDRIGNENGTMASYAGFLVVASGEEGAESGALRGALKVGGTACQVPNKPLASLAAQPGWKKLLDSGKLVLMTALDPFLGCRSIEDRLSNKRLALSLGASALLVNTESMDDPAWVAVEEHLGKYESVPIYFQETPPVPEYMGPLFDMGLKRWPHLNGVVDFHTLVLGERKEPDPVPLPPEGKYEEVPPQEPEKKADSPAAAPAPKPLSAEDAEAEARRKAGLAELEKLLSRLTDKEGISAKDIVYETVQVLTDKGKMDPIVAAVLQNVSFPGA